MRFLEDRRTIESHAGVTMFYNYGALRSSKCYHCIMWYRTVVTDDTSTVYTPAGLYGVEDTLMHHPIQPLGSFRAALNSDILLRYYTLSLTLYPVYVDTRKQYATIPYLPTHALSVIILDYYTYHDQTVEPRDEVIAN